MLTTNKTQHQMGRWLVHRGMHEQLQEELVGGE